MTISSLSCCRSEKPIEVLHVVNKWAKGGVERFIEELVSGFDSGISSSILSICTRISSSVSCPKYGPMFDGVSMFSMLKGAFEFEKFLENKHFDVVHIHTQNSSGFLYASMAKRKGVAVRIIHSHNTRLGADAGISKKMAQKVFRDVFSGSETLRLACSSEAGFHLFPGKDFRIIPNGIDVDRFAFDINARSKIRSDLGLSEEVFLVGSVGSLIKSKNHIRALAVFDELRKMHPNSKLVILGEGELRCRLEDEVSRRGLDDLVAMPGFAKEAHYWYSAMDSILFPSLYEGLPISLVEAQCNGLPVICSDVVTQEVCLLDTCQFVSLEEDDSVWARLLKESKRDKTPFSANIVREKGFDIESTRDLLAGIYESACVANFR